MFLKLNHQKLEVYQSARKFISECYKLTTTFPHDERFNMVQQNRRAALSVQLNLAEGASRRSAAERKRYYEISRGSIIEIDAALDVAADLEYFKIANAKQLGELMITCFKTLTGLMGNS